MNHLIFFDDRCPLCLNAVNHIYELDEKKQFSFTPLTGKTAQEFLKGDKAYLKEENTLVLLEFFQGQKSKIWVRGRAVARICWLLGGKWRLVGWLCYLPFVVDLPYRLIARYRHQLSHGKRLPDIQFRDRFLS